MRRFVRCIEARTRWSVERQLEHQDDFLSASGETDGVSVFECSNTEEIVLACMCRNLGQRDYRQIDNPVDYVQFTDADAASFGGFNPSRDVPISSAESMHFGLRWSEEELRRFADVVKKAYVDRGATPDRIARKTIADAWLALDPSLIKSSEDRDKIEKFKEHRSGKDAKQAELEKIKAAQQESRRLNRERGEAKSKKPKTE